MKKPIFFLMLCCAVFLSPKQFALEGGLFFIRFANASEKKTTSPFPSGMNLPIQEGRERHLFSFYPQKQYVIAVNKKASCFSMEKLRKKRMLQRRLKKSMKHQEEYTPTAYPFCLTKT